MALKECKECGKEVSTSADTCPHCGVNNPTEPAWIKAVSVIVVILFFGWFCSSFGDDDSSNSSSPSTNQTTTNNTSWENETDKIAAYIMAQGFVEDRLKSPSTAEFPDAWDGFDHDKNINYLGDQTYQIKSYVDSENSFGARIRSNFTAKIKQTKEDKWTLLNLNLK